MSQLTMNDVPSAIQRLLEINEQQQQQINSLVSRMDNLVVNPDSNMLFGCFKPKDIIFLSDKRLYQGNNAPFKSYNAAYRFSQKPGSPFRAKPGYNRKCCTAEALHAALFPEVTFKR